MRFLLPLCLLTACLFGVTPNCEAGLIISEIMYKPSGTNNSTTTGDEWFEVFNAGVGSVDLANYNFDDDLDAATSAGGIRLTSTPTNLSAGQYAIIGQKSLSAWQTVFGTLPAGTTYINITSGWQTLADSGEPLTLFDRVSGTNVFTVDYTQHPQRNGVSLQFVGTDPLLAQPYSFTAGHWQDATTVGGGTSGDKHTAGYGTLVANTAPEPASFALLSLAGMGLTAAVRRQRKAQAKAQA